MPCPPRAGELLPRAREAFGVRKKLAGYSLNMSNEGGRPKAQGFKQILGITLDDLDYLAASIKTGVITAPVESVRANPPHGINCIVVVPIRGLNEKSARIIDVRTVWEIAGPGTPPRLVSAFPRP
jgi:hypothetical protein